MFLSQRGYGQTTSGHYHVEKGGVLEKVAKIGRSITFVTKVFWLSFFVSGSPGLAASLCAVDPFTLVSKRSPMMVATEALEDASRFSSALERHAGMKLRRGIGLVLEPRGCETTSGH